MAVTVVEVFISHSAAVQTEAEVGRHRIKSSTISKSRWNLATRRIDY